jgi:hypothetical protein
MNLLQILPRVPPATCGVGDYAWRIARSLRDSHGIQSQFLSAGTTWVQPKSEPEFPVFRLGDLRSDGLIHALSRLAIQPDAILLHVSPYGYQKRALPGWLASAWSQVFHRPERPALMTMFHELFASGPPTTSAFWLQPLQKLILRRLAANSDARRTNREDYARWLDSKGHGQPTRILPVFSNFGESTSPVPLSQREPSMVMFAWANHSRHSLQTLVLNAAGLAAKFGLTRLHLIGDSQSAPATPTQVEMVRHGFLEETAAAALISSSRMAYTAYSPAHFGKSTLMAAFAAHGLAVITQGDQPHLPDGLSDGREVFHEAGLSVRPAPELSELQAVASNLHAWYLPHSLFNTAKSYADHLHEMRRAQKP